MKGFIVKYTLSLSLSLSDEWPVLAVGADWSTHWNMIQAFDDMDKGLIG